MGMPALHRRRRWTVSDVRALMDEGRPWPRYELLDGELLVTPSPTPVHQLAVIELAFILKAYVDEQRLGLVVTSPADLQLAPESITQPDVFVIPNEVFAPDAPMRWMDVTSLLLAAEVLSPSTVQQDRITKREFYLDNGVEEYWIIDPDAGVFERWTRSADRPDICRDEISWRPHGSSRPLAIDVRQFFQKVRAALTRR